MAHAVALLEVATQTTRPDDPAMLTLPFPSGGLATMEPAAGPEPADALAPAGEPVADALTVPPEAWASSSPMVCDPRLLRALRERREQLDARAAEVDARIGMLEVIEQRVAEQMRALEAHREALEASLTRVEETDQAELARLVTIYESMKPKEAARIFEAMPAEVAAGFIRRMRETKSAGIMANLQAGHAYAITLALASRGRGAAE